MKTLTTVPSQSWSKINVFRNIEAENLFPLRWWHFINILLKLPERWETHRSVMALLLCSCWLSKGVRTESPYLRQRGDGLPLLRCRSHPSLVVQTKLDVRSRRIPELNPQQHSKQLLNHIPGWVYTHIDISRSVRDWKPNRDLRARLFCFYRICSFQSNEK